MTETSVMRPSIFSIPVVAARALRARLDMWWIKTSIDPHFDEKDFLSNAVDAYSVVMAHFADNEMNALNPMLSKKVFNAFRDTWIEYDRQNLAIELNIEKNENPVIVDMSVSVGSDDDDDNLTQEEINKVIADLRRANPEAARSETGGTGAGIIGDGDNSQDGGGGGRREFDSGKYTLRLLVTVRFNTSETCRLVNRVTGNVQVTKDLRGHEWTFGRDLPRILPAKEPVTSPWNLTTIA